MIQRHLDRPLSQPLLSKCQEQLAASSEKMADLEKGHYPLLCNLVQLIAMDGNFTQEKANSIQDPPLLRKGLTFEHRLPANEVKTRILNEYSEMEIDIDQMKREIEKLKLAIPQLPLPKPKNILERIRELSSWFFENHN